MKLKRGVDELANAVKVTLGPKGRNVAIEQEFGAPNITHDGVTIAKEINLTDKYENMGAELVKEVAIKTNDVAGDGTTTATILAQVLIDEGLKLVAAGINPVNIRKDIENKVNQVVESLKNISKEVSGSEDIAHVATISSLSEEVGKLISEAMEEVGKEGIITVEESNKIGLSKEVVQGMQFDKGYISPYMITDTGKMESVLEKPSIIIADKRISSAKELFTLIKKIVEDGNKDILVIADDVDGEALATIIINKLKGSINILAVKSPGFGDNRRAVLGDIAVLTGGQIISEQVGLKLEKTELDMLGRADKVIATKDRTIIVNGNGKEQDIKEHIEKIKTLMEQSESDYAKRGYKERIAKLTGGIAVIKVGAASEVEQKERQSRVEDALAATKAAVEEGIVPGGGIALAVASGALHNHEDETSGSKIVSKACLELLLQIATNAGKKGDKVLLDIITARGDEKGSCVGYNAENDKVEDLMEAGIIDPTKVVRSALQNAASVAGILLTTEAAIIEEKKGRN